MQFNDVHLYSAVLINLVKRCVKYNRAHATFDQVYLDSIVVGTREIESRE